MFKITFLTTFILIIKLCNSIIDLWGENIKKNIDFSLFCHILQNLPDFSLFQKNYKGIFEFYRKRALKWCVCFYNSMKLKYTYTRLGASRRQKLPPTDVLRLFLPISEDQRETWGSLRPIHPPKWLGLWTIAWFLK